MLKHVGKMKHNDARVCIVYRTLPGDAYSALVVGTATLPDQYHNALMSLIESQDGQQANELGDALSSRPFPDGTNMLEQLHLTGKLVKVATDKVWMTPTPANQISLDELNLMIAEQKGVTLDDLSIKAEMPHIDKNKSKVEEVEIKDISSLDNTNQHMEPTDILIPPSETSIDNPSTPKSASEYRSRADKLYKEAAKLRKIADEIDPPKKRTSVKKNAETT